MSTYTTLGDAAKLFKRAPSVILRRAVQHGVPMHKAINPKTNHEVNVFDEAGMKAMHRLYPKKLEVRR